jgi:hypothetical protein
MPLKYWEWLKREAAARGFDGCTGVPEFFHLCCLEHDFAYRTGLCPRDYYLGRYTRTDRAATDRRFRLCIQSQSKLGKWSPLSWWRWAGVRLLAGKAWKGQ